MKILQISPQIPFPLTGGGKKSIFGLMKYLSNRGHDIHFVCYTQHTDYKNISNELKKYCKPYFLNVQTDNNIWGAILNLFSKVPYNISKYNRKELRDFLSEFLKKEEIDIVHINNLHMAWCIDIIRKLSNVPVVLRQENLEMMIMKRYSEKQTNFFLKKYSNIQYLKFVKYEPSMCKKFDMCIMITENDQERLLEHDKEIKICFIPSGIESSLLDSRTGNQIENFSLAHIGDLNWYPNYDGLKWFITEIFPQIILKIPQIKLYIYGGGEPKDFIIPKKLSAHIIVEGFVDDLWTELSKKSLAVVPLRIGSGIRIKILELLAFGTNIITTDIGKEGIEVQDGRELLVANSKEEFAQKIINFFNGKFKNTQMINDGKRLIKENYTWEKITKKFEDLYISLLS